GLVPYRSSAYTANVYPTKLNEYLAMGIPVVATDLPEIRRFNAEHGPCVAVATDPNQAVQAINTALEREPSTDRERRIAIARENSWQTRIAKMSALIVEALDREPAEGRWEKVLLRLYRRARRRAGAVIVGIVFLYVISFETSLPWVMAEVLRAADAPRSSDAIVVFAGGVGESGEAGGGYQERVKQAVDLYQAGYAPRVIFSSGYEFVFPETQVMRDLAISQGVPPGAILLESEAANTYAHVTRVRAILDRHGWRRALLVSSPYHMRRAMLTWRRVAPEIEIIPTPVPQSQFYTHARGASLQQLRGLLHEVAAIVVYWWRGWI
ncbi:MAG: glycosyltransferase, partial [SAR202 cluster bacterium]|nr:glycosyltransferase [SAR202 cluster bacterium]